jgi:phosphonate transport system substrate-binding protein
MHSNSLHTANSGGFGIGAMMLRLLLGAAIVVLLGAAPVLGAEEIVTPAVPVINVGSFPMDVPAAMAIRLAPLIQYLADATGYRFVYHPSLDLRSTMNDLGRGVTQLAYVTPVAYIEARAKYRATPLAKPLSKGKATFRLVIVTREDSMVKNMRDLHGKRFAFGDQDSLLQRAVLQAGGIAISDFRQHAFLKHFDNVAKAVLNGDFDAGIMKEAAAEQFKPQGLRVIYASEYLQPYLFAATDELPMEVKERIRSALLALKPDSPAHSAVLNTLEPGYTGFVPATDQDYDTTRKLVAPFQKSSSADRRRSAVQCTTKQAPAC